jgi:hypothetical protein
MVSRCAALAAGSVLLLTLSCVPVFGQDASTSSDDSAQSDAPQVRVGVLPFVDASGSAGVEAGLALGRLVQAEIVHSTDLMGRVLTPDGVRPEDVDVEKAAEIGRQSHVDVILIGTVLEARSEYSNKGGYTPRVFGQSVGGNVRSTKATVMLQGDLVDVATGKRMASLRVKGNHSDTKVGASVYTELGSISSDGSAFMESPLGQALQEAVTDLVKRLSTQATKIKPAA